MAAKKIVKVVLAAKAGCKDWRLIAS